MQLARILALCLVSFPAMAFGRLLGDTPQERQTLPSKQKAEPTIAAKSGTPANMMTSFSTCLKPGYVFIPCQMPVRNPMYIGWEKSLAEGQRRCEWDYECIAFTSNGDIFNASPNNGKLGALISTPGCQPGTKTSKESQCIGTYVFDGTVSLDVVHGGISGNTGGYSEYIKQLYLRAKSNGYTGLGKIGVHQCSLC